MSTTISPPTGPAASPPDQHNSAVEAQLDALMPKPASRITRWVVGMTLVIGTLVFSYLVAEGLIVPRPTSNGSWGGSQQLTIAEDGSGATAEISIPNWSGRTVRVTDIILPHADVVLVDVVARFDPPTDFTNADCQTTTGGGTICSVVSESTDPTVKEPMFPLPMDLPSGGGRLILDVTFAPADCSDPASLGVAPVAPADWNGEDSLPQWGDVEARFDFGEGAFPPFGRTVLLDDQIDGPFFGSVTGAIEVPGVSQAGAEQNLLQKLCELTSS